MFPRVLSANVSVDDLLTIVKYPYEKLDGAEVLDSVDFNLLFFLNCR